LLIILVWILLIIVCIHASLTDASDLIIRLRLVVWLILVLVGLRRLVISIVNIVLG
jgi:hypothetical protein